MWANDLLSQWGNTIKRGKWFTLDKISSFLVRGRDLLLADDALLYVAYVILILATPIPADRWHCSLWP